MLRECALWVRCNYLRVILALLVVAVVTCTINYCDVSVISGCAKGIKYINSLAEFSQMATISRHLISVDNPSPQIRMLPLYGNGVIHADIAEKVEFRTNSGTLLWPEIEGAFCGVTANELAFVRFGIERFNTQAGDDIGSRVAVVLNPLTKKSTDDGMVAFLNVDHVKIKARENHARTMLSTEIPLGLEVSPYVIKQNQESNDYAYSLDSPFKTFWRTGSLPMPPKGPLLALSLGGLLLGFWGGFGVCVCLDIGSTVRRFLAYLILAIFCAVIFHIGLFCLMG